MRILAIATLLLLLSTASSAPARPVIEEPAHPPLSAEVVVLDAQGGQPRSLLKLQSQSLGRPVAVADSIYVAGSDHALYAIDAKAGAMKWQYVSAAPLQRLTATAKAVFVGGGSQLVSLDAESGKVLWRFDSDTVVNDPTVVEHLVVFNSLDGPVAVEQGNGQQVWRLAVQWGYFVYSPLTESRLCVWKPDEMVVVETERGKTLWQSAADQSVSAPGALPSAAVGAGDMIFQLRGTSKDAEDWSLMAREAASGRQVWRTAMGQHEAAGARTFVAGKTAFCVLEDRLAALDVGDGKLRWNIAITPMEAGGPPPVAVGGLVYLPLLGGDVTAVSELDGKIQWTNAAPVPSPKARIRIGGLCATPAGVAVVRNEELRE